MGNKLTVDMPFWIIVGVIVLFFTISVYAVPEGPSTITQVSNSTRAALGTTIYNATNSGGYIHVINLTAVQTNTRWKGFVGNVTGRLTLDSSAGSTLYDWTLTTSVTGEVYSTRSSAAITWGNINCTWAWANGSLTNLSLVDNRTFEDNESSRLGGFTADDNLTATFDIRNHSSMAIGTVTLPASYCWATNPYRNNVSNPSYFDEIILYDNASIVYATFIETDQAGFDSDTYDFEMIVPQGNQTGSIAYYFYIEII